jgi:hypothetical protein
MLFLRYYLWIAPHLLSGLLLILCVRRKLHTQLPIFFSYVAFELAQFITLFTMSRIRPFPFVGYRWALVSGLTISTCLQLGIIYELSNELFFSRSPLNGIMHSLLRWIAALLVLVAAVACGMLPAVSVQRVMSAYQGLDFFSSFLRAGFLMTLFVLSSAFHISWRSWPAGVALGFGTSSCLDLASAALRTEFGSSGVIAIDAVQMAAFHVCVVIWLVYLFLPERASTFVGRGLEKSELEFWDQELQRMVRR